ncbi:hypothetical protein SPONN_2126 [uncultured Candidatus Thioglobus sp.]|nr:hypothetical protein SPONL_1203 [uncultured Candidatus Thioglobus sp.]SMM98255.1 hypothetical protein SPONN_1885 [uncultured Candidatus Thioglobus sp.]SMM98333.1 hypothetical protein SPONN_2126 [uncultured Candidatus Thioglobus sp.]
MEAKRDIQQARKGAVITASIVGIIAVGVFVATIVLYNPTG